MLPVLYTSSMKKEYIYGLIALIIFVGGPMGYWAYYMSQPGPQDALATCIKDSGATFFGAFWCPHCQEQKAMFGKSVSLLPYTECSMPDGKSQRPECTDEGITTYPTWEFADGSRITGTQSLATLAEKTGCSLN